MVSFTGLSPKQAQAIEVLKNHISLLILYINGFIIRRYLANFYRLFPLVQRFTIFAACVLILLRYYLIY